MEPSKPTNSTGDAIADIVGETIDASPVATVDAIQSEQNRLAEDLDDTTDSNGSEATTQGDIIPPPTDDIYERDDDGNKIPLADGTGFRRRRGRKSSPKLPPTPIDPLVYSKTGKTTVAAVEGLAVMYFGREWIASPEEKTAMTEAFAAAYEAYGIKDLPPWAAVAVVMLCYAGTRIRMPETAGKIARVKMWIATKYLAWKDRRKMRTGPPVSRVAGVVPEAG